MESINREELERAAKRIMEMNKAARQALEKTQNREENESEKEIELKKCESPKIEPPKKTLFDIINFKNLKGDRDRTLIAGIMLLLSGEQADEKLLLALLYIML